MLGEGPPRPRPHSSDGGRCRVKQGSPAIGGQCDFLRLLSIFCRFDPIYFLSVPRMSHISRRGYTTEQASSKYYNRFTGNAAKSGRVHVFAIESIGKQAPPVRRLTTT